MVRFTPAEHKHIADIVALLADDPLGKTRENTSAEMLPRYMQAFENIEKDPNNKLIAIMEEEHVIGCLQLTFIPYLTHMGSTRCLIEGVRIHPDYRGQAIGKKAFEWAIFYAKTKGCHMVQLTCDKSRHKAKKFYENLGFIASHEGMKLHLS